MNTQDYRLAPSGDGEQANTWKDKPHRLVYDLCSEVERLQQKLEIAAINQDRLGKLFRGEGDYPKLLIHNAKYGDKHILIMDEDQEDEAWLTMFQAIDRWDGFYDRYVGDNIDILASARSGNKGDAKLWLQIRVNREYEGMLIECIETPYSLRERLK